MVLNMVGMDRVYGEDEIGAVQNIEHTHDETFPGSRPAIPQRYRATW